LATFQGGYYSSFDSSANTLFGGIVERLLVDGTQLEIRLTWLAKNDGGLRIPSSKWTAIKPPLSLQLPFMGSDFDVNKDGVLEFSSNVIHERGTIYPKNYSGPLPGNYVEYAQVKGLGLTSEKTQPLKRILWLHTSLPHAQSTFSQFPKGLYAVVFVRSTQECLNQIREGSFDIIITEFQFMPTDYKLEEIDRGCATGAKLYHDIRSLNPTIPVFFYTAAPTTPQINRFNGPDEYCWVVYSLHTSAVQLGQRISEIFSSKP
jgi:hypothetical protein